MKIKPDRVSALHRVRSWDPEIRVWLTDWRRGFGVDTEILSFTWRAGEADWKAVQPRVVAGIMAQLMWGGLCCTGCSTCTRVLRNAVTLLPLKHHCYHLARSFCTVPASLYHLTLDQNLQQLIPGHLAKRCSREVGKASLWYYWHFGRSLACVYTEYNFQVKDSHEILLSTLDDAQLVLKYLKGIWGVLA